MLIFFNIKVLCDYDHNNYKMEYYSFKFLINIIWECYSDLIKENR